MPPRHPRIGGVMDEKRLSEILKRYDDGWSLDELVSRKEVRMFAIEILRLSAVNEMLRTERNYRPRMDDYEKMREALEFYADDGNYDWLSKEMGVSSTELDRGKAARAALGLEK